MRQGVRTLTVYPTGILDRSDTYDIFYSYDTIPYESADALSVVFDPLFKSWGEYITRKRLYNDDLGILHAKVIGLESKLNTILSKLDALAYAPGMPAVKEAEARFDENKAKK